MNKSQLFSSFLYRQRGRVIGGVTLRVPVNSRFVLTEPVNQLISLCKGPRFPWQFGQKKAENALRTFLRCGVALEGHRTVQRPRIPADILAVLSVRTHRYSDLIRVARSTVFRQMRRSILSFRSVHCPRSGSSLVHTRRTCVIRVGRAAVPLAPERVYKTNRRYRIWRSRPARLRAGC